MTEITKPFLLRKPISFTSLLRDYIDGIKDHKLEVNK